MARNVKLLTNDIKQAVSLGGQIASVNIMNSLSKKGPSWTGKFSSAWSAVSGRKKTGEKARGQGNRFVYSLNDVKRAVIPKKIKGNYSVYTILNSSSYADQALDINPFVPTKNIPPEPKGVRRGKREKYRGLVSEGEGGNRSTAPLDWYPTYLSSAKYINDFKTGMREGFKQSNSKPGT